MREIEVKVRVESLGAIRAALKQKGVRLSEPVTHHDIVWGLPGVPSGTDDPWLRLRTETKGNEVRHLFTMKRSVAGRQLDSIEHETEVSDPEALVGIVENINFALYSDITKTREKAHYGDIELCLDNVDGLGEFVEAEKLTVDDADFQAVTSELWGFLESLGASRHDEVTDGYDVLVNRKLGKE